MGKTVTFSFSTKYEGSGEIETFPFEKLGIDENLDDEALQKVLEGIFQAWALDKLNISFSIVIEEGSSVD